MPLDNGKPTWDNGIPKLDNEKSNIEKKENQHCIDSEEGGLCNFVNHPKL